MMIAVLAVTGALPIVLAFVDRRWLEEMEDRPFRMVARFFALYSALFGVGEALYITGRLGVSLEEFSLVAGLLSAMAVFLSARR